MATRKHVTTDPTLNKNARITIRLTPHLDHELTNISRDCGVERSQVVRAALLKLVEAYRP